jgi:glycerol kinase
MNDFILSLDQGTTSSRAIVFDSNGLPAASAQKEFNQIFPKPDGLNMILVRFGRLRPEYAAEALEKAGLESTNIAAIGITNQRETTVVWNRLTGRPVYNAIVWQDRRTAGYCDRLRMKDWGRLFLRRPD